jgi:PAS domain S-box-containing protein
MIREMTQSEPRKTGIDGIDDVQWGTHSCYFYETKSDLVETLVRFFKAGLESKEFCVWVLAQALSVEEAADALRQAVPDLDGFLAEGALEIHSHDQWYLGNGQWDSQRVLQSWGKKISQASANGYTGLRVSGDGGWIQHDDWMSFRDYEKEVNLKMTGQRSIVLCTYPLDVTPGNRIFDVAQTHHVAVARRNGNWEILEAPGLKEGKVEIKRLNEQLEAKVEERTKELAATNEALRAEIAERKLAEKAVRHAEDRIRLVIDTIPTMAWSLEPDGRVAFVNQRWMEYTGLSLEEALTKANSIVHPDDLPQALEAWAPNMVAGNPHEAEMRFRRVDGEYRWFLVRVSPLRDAQGEIVKWYGVSIDIEDRKQAEMQARVLIDAIPQQIWSAPADGRTDYCNDRWRAYSGLTLEDLRGYGWKTMVHPEDRDRVLKAWHESVANGTPYEQEERHRGADGKYRWFLSLAVPLRDAEGRIVRWYGTNTDIEDRKLAEEALRESETRFRQMAENISAVFWLTNPDETLLHYISPAYGKIWGRSLESIYENPHSWMDSVHPDDREGLIKDERARSMGVRRDRTYRIVRPDGSVRWIRGRAFPVFDKSRNLIRVAGISEDVTERKLAEEELKREKEILAKIFNNIPAMIGFIGADGGVKLVNPAWEQTIGWTLKELREQNVDIFAEAYPDPSYRQSVLDFVAAATGEWTDLKIKVRDGRVIDAACAVVRLSEGTKIAIARDVTERKRAAEQLEEANRQLRILSSQLFHIQDEERRHLARELHDEIGQALTAAKINLKIIAPDVPAKVASRLEDSVAVLDHLLQQVRQLSLDLHPSLLEDLGLTAALRSLLDQQAQRAGIRSQFYASESFENLDSAVQTAGFRIAQEAITNVLRHAKAKSVGVHLQGDAGELQIRIVDDGTGFDVAEVGRHAHNGAGFGLMGMRERAALVGGRVQIISSPGKGTKVEVSLPLKGCNEDRTE